MGVCHWWSSVGGSNLSIVLGQWIQVAVVLGFLGAIAVVAWLVNGDTSLLVAGAVGLVLGGAIGLARLVTRRRHGS